MHLLSTRHKADVIVIGVGSMGSATCYHLAKKGYRVIGLERFGIVHDMGAHGGYTRIIRKAYFEHPDYIPLLEQAYQNWRALEAASGQKLYHPTGLLYAGPKGHTLLERVKQSASAYAIPLEEWTLTETNKRFPAFCLPPHFSILFEPDAGYLEADTAIQCHCRMAKVHGAEIVTNCQVTGWEKAGEGVAVYTSNGTYYADKLVLTAGPWSAQLIPALHSLLTVTRQVLAWITPPQPAHFTAAQFPCWLITENGLPGAYYGFPCLANASDPLLGLKIAYHHRGSVTKPDQVNRVVTQKDTAHLLTFMKKYIPSGYGSVRNTKTCLYSYSPDEHFIIDRLPGMEDRVSLAWGFSGHGYKFAAAVGEILSSLAIEGKTTSPIEFLRASRFSS